MIFKKILLIATLAVLFGSAATPGWGATAPGLPQWINLQGRFIDNNDMPITYCESVAGVSYQLRVYYDLNGSKVYPANDGIGYYGLGRDPRYPYGTNYPFIPGEDLLYDTFSGSYIYTLDGYSRPIPFNYPYRLATSCQVTNQSWTTLATNELSSIPFAITAMNVYGGVGYFAGPLSIGTSETLTYQVRIKGGTFYSQRGGVCAAGYSWSVGSDRRWKKNISPLENSLQKVCRLQGVNFELRAKEFPDKGFPSAPQIGLIAQDVEKVIPQLVNTDPAGFKSVAYGRLGAVLVEAVKELKAENDALEARVAAIERQLAKRAGPGGPKTNNR